VKRQDFEQAFTAARFYTPSDVSPARVPVFTKRLMGLVTPQGLRKVAGQYELAKKGEFNVVTLGDCSRSFRNVFGLPCKHEIARQLHFNKEWKLGIEDVDPYWYFKREDLPLPIPLPPIPEEARILEPEVVKTRGRPKKTNIKKTDTSTQRDPSAFELVNQPSGTARCRRGRPPGSKNKLKITQNSTQQPSVNSQTPQLAQQILQTPVDPQLLDPPLPPAQGDDLDLLDDVLLDGVEPPPVITQNTTNRSS